MLALLDAADSVFVTEDESRGEAIQRRLERLGISDREFHSVSGVDRKTLRRATSDDPSVRDNTYRIIEDSLTKLEQRNRGLPASNPEDDLVEFRLSGDFGVTLVVRGPVRDRGEMEESVARLIREMRSPEKGDQ